MTKAPRVVLVTRQTEYTELLHRHATHGQAAFFLKSRGLNINKVRARHLSFEQARELVLHSIPMEWRRTSVGRADLCRFVFEPEDIVVALGQDGLVANTAKYLHGQVVIGLNAEPERNMGVLVLHAPQNTRELLDLAVSGRCKIQSRTMVEARLDDGQRLLALNEVFVGHRSHQSARYQLCRGEQEERQVSSGVIISTGTGATGWAASINRERGVFVRLPEPEERGLAFFVREAYGSLGTGTGLTAGVLGAEDCLRLTSEMNDGGVLFGDGIEDDRLEFRWGMGATLRTAPQSLSLLAA